MLSKLFGKEDPLAEATEEETFSGDASIPSYLRSTENRRERELCEIELTISNVEAMLAQMYENLSDLKTQIEHLKTQENVDEVDRYERSREIAKRQTQLASLLSS